MQGWALVVVVGPGPAGVVALDGEVVVGRDPACGLVIDDPSVSRRHLRLVATADGVLAEDLGSSAGTTVDGVALGTGPARVRAGARLRVGPSELALLGAERLRLSTQPMVRVVGPDRTARLVEVGAGGVVVGRDPGCDVVVDHPSVSRRHLALVADAGRVWAEDLGSSAGSRLGGDLLRGRPVLAPGDVVELAGGVVRVELSAAGEAGGPVAFEVADGPDGPGAAVEVDAAATDAVGEVTEALAAHLDRPGDGPGWWLLWRPGDGTWFHPASSWGACTVARADLLALARMPGQPPDVAERPGPAAPRTVAVPGAPRASYPPGPHPVEPPRSPDTASLRGRGVFWQVLGGSAALLLAAAVVLVRPDYAVFAVIGGLVGVVSVVSGVAGDQSRRRAALGRFRDRLGELGAEMERVRAEQTARLERAYPGPDELAARAASASPGLWDRRPGDPDAGHLRLGTGRVPARWDQRDRIPTDGAYDHEVEALLGAHRWLDDAPVVWSPSTAPLLGLVGPRPVATAAARALLAQAVVLHGPRELEVVVLGSGPAWGWARWLPHLADGAAEGLADDPDRVDRLLRRLHDEAAAPPGGRGAPARPRRLVVADLAALGGGRAAALEALAGRDQAVVVVAADQRDLPTRVDAVATCQADGTAVLAGPFEHGPAGPVRLDRVAVPAAEAVARAVGRLGVPGAAPAGAGEVGLVDLLGLGAPATADIARAWTTRPGEAASAVVGRDPDGQPVVLRFRRDGPHGMIAGTTGSGKSELLQTLVASLVATHPPDALALFLIDFKGGATFSAFAGLPHTVGLVTDLERDASLSERAFDALSAEMARRKQVLDQARVGDVIAYEQLPESVLRPLPTLLVVIDEFALLVRAQPDVRRRLDLVATQGRSLGVHLLLATQSPSGVVTQDIRANTNLWVCLRVVNDGESTEILGRRDAARIPADRPGRGFLRLGAAEELTALQVARVSRPLAEGGDARHVAVRPFGGAGDRARASSAPARPAPRPGGGRAPTELEVLMGRISAVADELGVAPAASLWLPPLPERILDAELELPPAGSAGEGLVAWLGLSDDPTGPVQAPWPAELSALGHLLVAGGIGSGKTTTLLRTALDLARRLPPADLHVHALDGGSGSLAPLADLPHTAAHVGAGDEEMVHRFFDRLVRLVDERREDLARTGAAGFLARRRLPDPPPWVLVVVDDYPALRELADRQVSNVLTDAVLRLAQQGPGLGVHLALATTQVTDLRVALLNLFGVRVLHRQADVSDFSVVGLRARAEALAAMGPGRAWVPGPLSVQVALPPVPVPAAVPQPGGPRRLRRLPAQVTWAEVAAEAWSPPGQALLGLGGPDVAPVAWDLERGEPALLVLGDAGSGRSQALALLARSVVAARPGTRVVALCPRPSTLPGSLEPAARVALDATTARELLGEVLATPGQAALVLLDDAEALWPGLGDLLEQLAREARERRAVLAVAGRVADLSRSFEGWVRYLLSLRHGVLLDPQPDSGFVFEVRLPATAVPPATGRGVLVRRGQVTALQLALPGPAFSGPSAAAPPPAGS